MNLLLSFTDFISQYWFVIVLVIIATIVFVPNIISAKKEKTRQMDLVNNLDKGVRVLTIFGVHGVVRKLIQKSDGFKYVVISSEDDKNALTLTVRVDAIAYIDDGVCKNKSAKKEIVEIEEPVEEVEDEVSEEVTEDKVEKKSTKTKSTKKK